MKSYVEAAKGGSDVTTVEVRTQDLNHGCPVDGTSVDHSAKSVLTTNKTALHTISSRNEAGGTNTHICTFKNGNILLPVHVNGIDCMKEELAHALADNTLVDMIVQMGRISPTEAEY